MARATQASAPSVVTDTANQPAALADFPELVGFFSYSRDDDDDAKGALSALRDAIQRELRGLLGRSRRELRLWQDKEAIAPGRLWKKEIAGAIGEAVFFIPIVTPTVVKSRYCRLEFEAFVERERAMGRTDLVFPILYIRVPELEVEARWRSDPVLSVIGERQYVDWRLLRLRPVDDIQVRQAIENFCGTIVEALAAPMPTAEQRQREADEQHRQEAARQQTMQTPPPRTLTGHTGVVWSVAFSPDGRMLASADDRTIKLWDPVSSQVLRTLTSRLWPSRVSSVAFSPDGRTLASGSVRPSGENATIKLWDPASGQLLRTLTGHTYAVVSVAFSPDGRMLASGSLDKTIKLWDPENGRALRTLTSHTGYAESVAFSRDGRMLASGGDDTIKLWDPARGQLLRTLTGHTAFVAFSPDERMLASGSVDKTIKLWDPASGQLLRTLTGHTDGIVSAVFSPDGRMLASGSWDRTIKLWDARTAALLATLIGHSERIAAVEFSPDGRTLVSASWDKTIRLWDVSSLAAAR